MIDDLKLRKVCEYNDEVHAACKTYFAKFPENEEWFAGELDELYWRFKYAGEYRNHISLTAVPLAEKIHKELGIITFPYIKRVACRGWDTSGGTWAWAMQTVYQGQYVGDIGSCDPVKYLLKKSIKLYALESSHGEIGGEKVPQPEGAIK